jgi:hypothetical protein
VLSILPVPIPMILHVSTGCPRGVVSMPHVPF